MRSTLKDIARKAGVSAVTVHKALYNKAGVGEATRRKILAIAEEMSYSVNSAASSLKREELTIAVVFPLLEKDLNYFFEKVWKGVEEAQAAIADFRVSVLRMPCGKTWESQARIMEEIIGRGDIDGVVVYCWDDTRLNGSFELLKVLGIPVVTVNSDAVRSCRIGSVTAPNRRTGRLAAELMCHMAPDTGRIVLLGGNRMMKNLREISFGFFSYVQENVPGLTVTEINDFETTQNLEEELLRTLGAFDGIVGVYCNSARNNLPMCRAIQRAGKAGLVQAIASDLYGDLVPYLEDGTVKAAIWQNQQQQAGEGVRMMFRFLTAKEQDWSETVQTVPIGVIMKNNYVDYL